MMLPPSCFTVGMVFFGLQASPFFLQTKQWSLWPNSCYILVSSDQRTLLLVPEYNICPVVQLQTVVWLFYGGFGAVASSLPFRLCRYRTRFYCGYRCFCTCFLQHLYKSFAAVLGLICTFPTKVRSSLGDRTHLLPEQYDSCVVPRCLYLRNIVCTDECGTFRRLEIAPKNELDLWRSTIFFLRAWLISFDFPMMSSK